MHVAYLIPTVDRIGGAERQVLLLANGLAARGYRVTVIALSGSGEDTASALTANGVSFQSLHMRKGLLDPRGWAKLHRWIRSNQPDVLHAHLPHAALLARCSRFFEPVPVLVDTIHSPHMGGFLRRIGYRLTSLLPDVVTSVSAAAAEPWLNARALDRKTITLIPNGVDLDHWRSLDNFVESPPGSFTSDRFNWLAVGRLDSVKDHATLLRAFAQLPSCAHLVIAGSGPLKSALESLARNLEIGNRVTFAGFQRDLMPLMQQSDAFVLTSRWEGLPVSLMEASACALPAVITNTAGSRELLPNSTAYSVPIGNADALAAAMSAMMDLEPSERRQLGTQARNRIAEHFNLDSMLDRYETLYRNALALSPRPARSRRSDSLLSGLSRSRSTET